MLGLDEKPKEVNHKPVIKIEEVEIDARLDYDDARDFEDEYGPVEAIADYSDEDVKVIFRYNSVFSPESYELTF